MMAVAKKLAPATNVTTSYAQCAQCAQLRVEIARLTAVIVTMQRQNEGPTWNDWDACSLEKGKPQ